MTQNLAWRSVPGITTETPLMLWQCLILAIYNQMWTFLREHNLPPESPSSLWCTLQIASRQIIWFYAADIHSTPTAHYKLDTTNYFQALSTIQDGGHVKIPLPGDITHDQNSYPGDRHYSQNAVGSPTPPPSGLTLIGALQLCILGSFDSNISFWNEFSFKFLSSVHLLLKKMGFWSELTVYKSKSWGLTCTCYLFYESFDSDSICFHFLAADVQLVLWLRQWSRAF